MASQNEVTGGPVDEDTLRAIAEVHKNDGEDEFNKKHFSEAISSYSEGIKVECRDEKLNAELFSGRANGHFCLGNYVGALNDARTATIFENNCLGAIITGAKAHVKLNQFEDAIQWCDEGLAVSFELEFVKRSWKIYLAIKRMTDEPCPITLYMTPMGAYYKGIMIDSNSEELLEIRDNSFKQQNKVQGRYDGKPKDKMEANTAKGETSGSLHQTTELATRSHHTGPFNVPFGNENVRSDVAAESVSSNIDVAYGDDLPPILVHISHREDSECAYKNDTNASDTHVAYINYSQVIDENLFPDLLNHLATAFLSKDYDRFWNVVECSSEILEDLNQNNKMRTSYLMTDEDVFQKERERVAGEQNISYRPEKGNITCVSVLFNSEIDPTGEMRKKMFDLVSEDEEEYESEISGKEKETQDTSIIDDFPSDTEEDIDEGLQATPEKPCYYPSQIEMAKILKKRIETIMEHHNNISSLSEAFDDVEFVAYTARYRMLSDQTEKRIFHPDAGVLSKDELETRDEENRKKRMFMYINSTENYAHFEQLKRTVYEKPKTLFIIIADECHWGITKGNVQKAPAHNLFINEWCKDNSPRNVVVLQISATPFNLLTINSRLPEVKCAILSDKVSTTQKDYAAGDLLVLDREPEIKERVRRISKEVELHVVHWSEVELKNFERGMRMKLKSTLINKDSPYRYLQVSSNGQLGVTTDEDKATNFIVQGSYGIVTIKAIVSEAQVVAITRDTSGTLVAKVDPQQPTKFEVKLDFGVGVAAFSWCDREDHYLAVNEFGHVNLQPAKVERKSGVSIMKPKHDLDGVSFQFYIDHCGPEEVDSAGQQYMSLNYYLSTMNCCAKNDQKIRQDTFFQGVVDKAKRENKRSKTESSSFMIDALLCAEYCYYVLHVTTYDSDDKIRHALTTAGICKPAAAQFDEKLNSFITKLKENTVYIQAEAFELVRTDLCEKVKQNFRKDCKKLAAMKKNKTSKGQEDNLQTFEELTTSFVACLMHLSQKDLENVIQETHATSIVEDIKQNLQMNDCEKMVKIWNQIVEEGETSFLVKSLIRSGKQESGKMKIVRARSMKTADQFFYTLRLARKMASQEKCFEIIRDYGSIQIEKQFMKSSSPFFQKLQPDDCQGKFDCRCTKLNLHLGRSTKCFDCQHVHKSITQYEDLENLACVLILVDKGRMGDTFPQSFDCLDLRLSYDSSREFKNGSKTYLSTVIQELGRMCRYAKVSVDESHVQNAPYVLVGRELFKKLESSVETSPAMSAVPCTRVDRYMTKTKRNPSSSLRWLDYEAHKDSYDHENEQKHRNRILLQAEPQIGKTGTYLCLIKHLRQDILGEENVSSITATSFNEGSFYLFKDGDDFEDPPVNNNSEQQDWQFPYWKAIQDSRRLDEKKVVPGKYSIGGRFYTHDTEENPYVLMKRGGSKPTKSGCHYLKTNCAVGERAWHWYHFEHCAECGRLLQGKEPSLETVEVNIDGKEMIVKCSIPAGSRPYINLLEQLTNSASTLLHRPAAVNNVPSLAYWIFHPSHRDDPRKCLLNYHHVMQKESHVASYIQVAVVRSEKFQAYRSTWGKVLAIFQLPDELPNCKVGPSEGGIGYARRFIQKIAFSQKLEYVFVIDDNVAVMSEAAFSSSKQGTSSESIERDENGIMQMQRCSFLRPLTYLQEIVEGKSIPPDGEKQYESHPLKEQFKAQQLPLYSYTGPAKLFGDKKHESYGVLGLLRSVPKAVRPFTKTQVYAAVLLNVKSTVEKEVFYRPWPCWEDLRFNDDCDKAGLWVVKCNRFLFHKVQYNDWIEGLACPSIFQWTENIKLEEQQFASELPKELEDDIILQYLRNLVKWEGHDRCFKGQIGNENPHDGAPAVCPTKLLEQLKLKDCKDQLALGRTVPVLILSYHWASKQPIQQMVENMKLLNERYCKTRKKIVFVSSAIEKGGLNVDSIRKGSSFLSISSEMADRNAEFEILSAADPTRHSLRWIVIEVSFPEKDLQNQISSEIKDGKRNWDTNSAEEVSDSKGEEGSFKPSELTVEERVEDPKANKRRLIPSSWKQEDVRSIDCDPNASMSQAEMGQKRESTFQVNTSRSSIGDTDNNVLESPTNKGRKVEDRSLPGAEAGTASPELERGNASFTITFPQYKENSAGKREAKSTPQEDASGDYSNASDDQQKPRKQTDLVKSSITGLKPDDLAYDEGANAVTKKIVDLWREKKKQANDKDIDMKRVESELDGKKATELRKLDSKGYTALTKACSLPSVGLHVVSYLIDQREVDVNSKLPKEFQKDDEKARWLVPGMSALSVAIRRGNVRCVSTFMNRKKDIQFWKKDCDGNTALHHCVLSRAKGPFEMLFPVFQQWENEKGKTWRDLRNKKKENPFQTALEEMRQVNHKKQSKAKDALELMLNQMDPSGQWKNQLESTASAKKVSKETVKQSAADPKRNENSNQKRITNTDAPEGLNNKRPKIDDRLLKSPTTSCTISKIQVTPVTPAQGTSVQVETKTPAENKKAAEMKSWFPDDSDEECPLKPKKQRDPPKSQITGLKPDDPAYVEGTNAVTKSIVDLWKEIIKEKSKADVVKDRTKLVLGNFDLRKLEERDEKGYNALTKACSLPSMSPAVVSYLIKTKEDGKKLDVNSQLPDKFQRDDEKARWLVPGMSALSVAIRRGNVKCVSTFMNREPDINFKSTDCDGNTALHHCALSPDISKTAFTRLFECFKPLEWRDMRNKQGKNPFDIALEQLKQTDATQEKKKKEDIENILSIMAASEQLEKSIRRRLSTDHFNTDVHP